MADNNSRILCFSCTHFPFHHPDAIAFLRAVKAKYRPTRVISLGDLVDQYGLSHFDKDPDMPSPGIELDMAVDSLKDLYKTFPKVDVVRSNHDVRYNKKAMRAGLPNRLFKDFLDIINAPKGWTFHFDLTTTLPTGKACYFHHSKGQNVKTNSQTSGMSFVQGHWHEHLELLYWSNSVETNFGMTVGALINYNSMAASYGINNLKRPVLGCAIIVEGIPQLVPMQLGEDGRWNGKL